MNWSEIFGTNFSSIIEVIIRGTITYLAIFVLLRVLPRESGTFSISDLIVVVVVADAAQNAMAGSYTSVPAGIVLVGTIVVWSFVLDMVAYRYPILRPLLQGSPVPLIRDGVLLRKNLRSQLLTIDELMGQLREHGIEDVHAVKRAFLEADGAISVIPFEEGGDNSPKHRKHMG